MVLTRVVTGILPLAVIGLCATAGVDYFAQSRRAAAEGRDLSVTDYLAASVDRARTALASLPGPGDGGAEARGQGVASMAAAAPETIDAIMAADATASTSATDSQISAMHAAADAELARLGLIEGREPPPGMLSTIMGLLQGGDGRAMEGALEAVEGQEAGQPATVVIRRAGQIVTE